MGRINTARVIIGGLVAGLVINIGETLLNAVVLAEEMTAIAARFNLPEMGGGTIGLFVLLCFLLGILTIWLYAAIRPRFGPGPKTAVLAGTTIWLAAYLFPGIGYAVMGFFPVGLTALSLGWALIEVLLAATAGAYFYTEPAVTTRGAARV
jgi:hypothetical protein